MLHKPFAAVLLALAFNAGLPQRAAAAPDAKRGAGVFATECAECHSVREGKDRKGPSLFAVIGRHSAAHSGFVYSEALRQSGIVWTPEALRAYIAAPKKAVPGGKMKYDGLDDPAQLADLLAYLATLTP